MLEWRCLYGVHITATVWSFQTAGPGIFTRSWAVGLTSIHGAKINVRFQLVYDPPGSGTWDGGGPTDLRNHEVKRELLHPCTLVYLVYLQSALLAAI